MKPNLEEKPIPLEVDRLAGWTVDDERLSLFSTFTFETPTQARRFVTYAARIAADNQVDPDISVADEVVAIRLFAKSTEYLNRKVLLFAELMTSTHSQHLETGRKLALA